MARIHQFLEVMQRTNASDLHLSDGSEPMLRINGVLERAKHRPLNGDEIKMLVYELLTETQVQHFEAAGELDFACTLPGVARFRVNAFRKHPSMAVVFRLIPHKIPTLDELGHPAALKTMLERRSGLILVTGPANSGKSTTLAAMVDHLNEHKNYHILTLEDPLEFIHTNKNCLINQRQIGEHSRTFADALRASLREDPNVVLVGEMRDLETIALAVTAAELGLLVLGTLHTKSSAQTISRIVDAFPVDQQQQIRVSVGEVLVGIVSQQLLRRADGRGRVAALEVMIHNHAIGHMIREGKAHQINNAIMTSRRDGMQLLDQHLTELLDQKVIAIEEAVRYAADPAALRVPAGMADPRVGVQRSGSAPRPALGDSRGVPPRPERAG